MASPELLDMLGPGHPLQPDDRAAFDAVFSADFSSVRIHASPAAASLAAAHGANAFALGSHLVFGAGQYDRRSNRGRWLLAHELSHVVQQHTIGRILLQRDDAPTADEIANATKVDFDEELIDLEENRKYKWVKYDDAAVKNRLWFDLFQLRGLNPFAPLDPFKTPNAFTNRVTEWQAKADRAKLAESVFAGTEGQRDVRKGNLTSIGEGIVEADKRRIAREKVKLGEPVKADGVLGPRTFWLMLATAALIRDQKNYDLLKKQGVDVDAIEPLTHDDRPEWGFAWRAVHAYLFNPPTYRSIWSTLVRSDIVLETYEEIVGLGEADRDFLKQLFFPDKMPEGVEINNDDYIAILARGYAGEALDGLIALMEVDRDYFSNVDIHRLLAKERPDWKTSLDVRFGHVDSEGANTLIDRFSLEIPTDAKSQETFSLLQQQESGALGTLARPDPTAKLAALVVVFSLPNREPGFWQQTAEDYVAEKKALGEAAEQATQEHFAALQERFEERMAGTADIGKNDAMAFLEVLVGPAFKSAQDSAIAFHKADAAKAGGEAIAKPQASKAAAKASELFTRAEKEGFLVVQLGDDKKQRFPLPLVQIELARARAKTNGAAPLGFDLIDTPHAAMHMYMPMRFSARGSADGGSEAVAHAYDQLDHDSSKGEKGRIARDWAVYRARVFAPFDPVLVEIREFNPDAGQLWRLGRQIGGTEKIVFRYVWTLGTSLPDLTEKLWDAQGTVNLFGWIDAILTIGALATLVAAPLIAGAGAASSTAGAQLGRAAVQAAMRKALVQALKKFVVTEAIGEALGRITYHINDSESVPEGVKKAWNGLMIAVLIYGIGATVRQGIQSFKNHAKGGLRAEIEALEAQLEAEAKGTGSSTKRLEEAAQADISERTAKKFGETMGDKGGPQSGPGRIRTDDPRAAQLSDPYGVPASATHKLNRVLGEDAVNTLKGGLDINALERLASVADDAAIKKLVDAFTPAALGKIVLSVSPEILTKLGSALDGPVLKAVLDAFAGSAPGVLLLKAFAGDPTRLATLLARIDAKRLLALASDPGAGRFYRVAALVHPDQLADVMKNFGRNAAQSLERFRVLIRDVGPETAAFVMNTYTAREMASGVRWRRNGGMSHAQNLARLAINRTKDGPTKARIDSGIPYSPTPPRRPDFVPGDFRAFHAMGPEATTPAVVRAAVDQVQAASAKAANHLDELIELAASGKLTDVDLQAVPPQARATVEAFLKVGADDNLRSAYYGSALQYLAEAELRLLNGGQPPPGMSFRPAAVKNRHTQIPDVRVEITLQSELRFPQTNKSELAVIDWTTAGEAGKIAKYSGRKPPVTYGIEIVQPGPPPVPPAPAKTLPPVTPKMPDAPPDTDTEEK